MALVALILVLALNFVVTLCLLNTFGNIAKHNALVSTSVFIAWFFSFNIILLLPLDITSTIYNQCVHASSNSTTPDNTTIINSTLIPPQSIGTNQSGILQNLTNNAVQQGSQFEDLGPGPGECSQPWSYISTDLLLTLWTFMYWSIQALTWIILPILQSYSMSGEFTKLGKLKSSLGANIRYSMIRLVFAVLFIVYLVASRSNISWEGLRVFCTSASNTFGLFLLIVLMGYGLVEIPRNFLLNYYRHYQYKLDYLYFKVAKTNGEMCEAETELEDCYDRLRAIYPYAKQKNDPFIPELNRIVSKLPESVQGDLQARTSRTNHNPDLEAQLNMKSLISLNAHIKSAMQTDHRTRLQYHMLVEKAIKLRDLIELENKIYSFSIETNATRLEQWICRRVPAMERILSRKHHFVRFLYAFLGYFFGAFSVLIVWSECTFFIQSAPLSFPALIVYLLGNKYLWIEVFSTLSIVYLCICAYYTVFKVRIFNFYYLANHQQTDEYSLLFCAILLCCLASPLCLNFLSLIHLDSHITQQSISEETAFTQIMGHMDTVSFISDHLSIYLPVIMSIFCVATFFKLGTKIVHYLGIDQFQLEDETTQDLVKQGSNLVTRQVQKRNRQANIPTNSQAISSALGTPQVPRFTSQDQLIGNQATNLQSVNAQQSTTYGVNFFDE